MNETQPEDPSQIKVDLQQISNADVEKAFNQLITPDSVQSADKTEANEEGRTNTASYGSPRAKTSLRMRYEAEREVISKKLGSIEDIRQELGLSRRKICQLLMVDPSAWTRWTKSPKSIPPLVYRSLQWYLALVEKHPQWHPQNAFLGAFRSQSKEDLGELEKRLESKLKAISSRPNESVVDLDEIQPLRQQISALQTELQRNEQVKLAWKMLLLMNTIALLTGFVYILTRG